MIRRGFKRCERCDGRGKLTSRSVPCEACRGAGEVRCTAEIRVERWER